MLVTSQAENRCVKLRFIRDDTLYFAHFFYCIVFCCGKDQLVREYNMQPTHLFICIYWGK